MLKQAPGQITRKLKLNNSEKAADTNATHEIHYLSLTFKADNTHQKFSFQVSSN